MGIKVGSMADKKIISYDTQSEVPSLNSKITINGHQYMVVDKIVQVDTSETGPTETKFQAVLVPLMSESLLLG